MLFGMPYVSQRSRSQGWGSSAVGGTGFFLRGESGWKDLKVVRLPEPDVSTGARPLPPARPAGVRSRRLQPLSGTCHNDPVNRSDPMGLVDMQWERQTWLQSGNLLSLAQFVREQLRAAGKAASEGIARSVRQSYFRKIRHLRGASHEGTSPNLRNRGVTTRERIGFTRSLIRCWMNPGTCQSGSGVRVKEEIAHDQQVDHKEFRLEKGENRTDAQGESTIT